MGELVVVSPKISLVQHKFIVLFSRSINVTVF